MHQRETGEAPCTSADKVDQATGERPLWGAAACTQRGLSLVVRSQGYRLRYWRPKVTRTRVLGLMLLTEADILRLRGCRKCRVVC